MPGSNPKTAERIEPLQPDADFNPFDPAFLADPYPELALRRERTPVYRSPLGFVLLFRHDDVVALLRDPSVSVEERHQRPTPVTEMMQAVMGEDAELGRQSMLNRDAPDHTRLRRLVSKAFTPKAIEALRPRVQRLVDEALAPFAAGDQIDVVSTLAFPVPFAVICEMLGMPETDRANVREWSHLMVKSLEPLIDPDLMRQIAAAAGEMRALIADVITWKRAHPARDMLSALITAEENGDALSDHELLEQVMLLFIAGHETTVNLIGNGMNALLRNPDQIPRFWSSPANAIEELLRYDSPVHMSRRITLRDIEVGDTAIEKGTFVVCVLASANRDARFWGPTGETLDLARSNASQHLSFGGGHHYCLGAALARLEGEVAIGSLLGRFPSIRPDGEPVPNGRINLRGRSSLPVSL